jgi:hypothetical protein
MRPVRIQVQRVTPPLDLERDLFALPQSLGARVHLNAWGCKVSACEAGGNYCNDYTADSRCSRYVCVVVLTVCVRILPIQVPAGEAGDYCNDYTAEAADMDAFMYKNPEALVIVAVGAAQFTCRKFTSTNSAYLLTGTKVQVITAVGDAGELAQDATVASPATNKNGISVGASDIWNEVQVLSLLALLVQKYKY